MKRRGGARRPGRWSHAIDLCTIDLLDSSCAFDLFYFVFCFLSLSLSGFFDVYNGVPNWSGRGEERIVKGEESKQHLG